jgi:hypothetical protein
LPNLPSSRSITVAGLLGVVAEGDPNVVESQSWPSCRDAGNAIKRLDVD